MSKHRFHAKCIARHEPFNIDDIVYVKAVEFRYSTPTLYAILNRDTGGVENYIDANTLKNRFERVTI